jgi:dimethylargininase
MRIAITRPVSPGINRCELTHLERRPIDIPAASEQHRRYEEILERLGCRIARLSVEPDLPDSVFVEDAAVVFPEIAVITRPGAESRLPEIPSVAAALAPYRNLATLVPPASLDGGDVLTVGRSVYVGISGRSNEAGIEQLRAIIGPLGYAVTPIALRECLHLKSGVTQIAPATLLINRRWVDDRFLRCMQLIDVDPEEPAAANALLLDDVVIYPAAFPRTMERLAVAGVRVEPVDVSELAKAEGGVTCCSLIFEERPRATERVGL